MSELTTGELLNELRDLLDRIEQIDQQRKPLDQRKREIENALLRRAQDDGTDQIGNDQITATVQHKTVARYDPDRWQDIVRWAVRSGNDHILQRRITDSQVEQLALDGVELPEGLSLEQIDRLSVRRK